MGRRISKEFLHPSILEGINNKIGNLDSLETDAKGNMVQAINELVEKLDNSAEIESGKELIANAVGEPLTAEESFDEMRSDINSLLSTFKTNMMNNGVTVESSDRFKSLIDKLATLADNEGKGIKYKTGNLDDLNFKAGTSTSGTITLDVNFEFTPNIVFIEGKTIGNMYGEDNIPVLLGKDVDVIINNHLQAFLTIKSYNSTSITFKFSRYTNELGTGVRNLIYHAIGVGEEDTTLRDSLASILENKGVDVTEEDDMTSLITKVDTGVTGLNIISATELPETVVNNQIVLITETKPGAIKLIPNDLCIPSVDSEINIGYSTSTNSYNYTLSQGVSSLTLYLNMAKQLVSSKTSYINGYIGLNNTWTQFSFSKNIVYDNGDDNLGISTASYWNRDENNGGWLTMTKNANNITIKLSGTGAEEYAGNKYLWCTKGIDFTNFNTCKVTYNYVDGTADMTFVIGPGYSSSLGVNQTLETTLNKDVTNGTMTYNISNLTGLYYIGAEGWANYYSGSDAILTITCIELTNN